MATMPHKHITASVVYVDPSATGANNGTTPADALTSFPTFTALAASTVYLLRRGGVYTIVPGSISSKHGLGIIGMPKPTDPLYDAVPAEAKAAWDADAADYAEVNIALNATSTTFNTSNGVTLHRLDVLSTQSIAQPAVPFIVFNTCTMVTVSMCKSHISGIDLKNAVTYAAAMNKVLTSWAFDSCKGVVIRSCYFERPFDLTASSMTSTEANGRNSAVRVTSGAMVVVDDCEFVVAFPGYQAGVLAGSGMLYVSTRDKENAVITRLKFTGVEIRDNALTYKHVGWAWTPALTVNSSRSFINKITVRMKKIGAYATPTGWTACADGYGGLSFACVNVVCMTTADTNKAMYGCEISDIDIDITGLGMASSGVSIAGGWSSNRTIKYGARWVVKNITFLAPQTAAIGNETNSFNAGNTPIGVFIGTMPDCYVENIDSRYPNMAGIALDFGGAAANNITSAGLEQTDYYAGTFSAKNVTAYGYVSAMVGYLDLDTMVIHPDMTGICLRAIGCAQVYVDTLTLPVGYSTTSNPAFAYDDAQILVNSVNAVASWTGSVTSTAAAVHAHTAISNSDGVAGAWRSHSYYARAVVGAVYRTGGAQGALYISTPTTPARLYGPWLAPFPYAAKQLDPGGTGVRLVKVHIAVKGFVANRRDLLNAIQIHVETPFSAYPKMRTYLSSADGWMEDDLTAVWNNDTGLTALVIVTPIKVDRYENIGVRVHFTPLYENGAYYYVDPKFDVVAG